MCTDRLDDNIVKMTIVPKKCNPYRKSNDMFRNLKKILKIHVKSQSSPNSENNLGELTLPAFKTYYKAIY